MDSNVAESSRSAVRSAAALPRRSRAQDEDASFAGAIGMLAEIAVTEGTKRHIIDHSGRRQAQPADPSQHEEPEFL